MHRLNEIDKHDKSGHRNFVLQKQNAIAISYLLKLCKFKNALHNKSINLSYDCKGK